MRTAKSARIFAAGPIIDAQVIYRLEPDGDGTRVFFEHSGFDMSQPWGEQAFRGAEFGWARMLERLPGVVGSLARRKGG
jgi:Activator of Hsp90 ATPase homolog 1-like protein